MASLDPAKDPSSVRNRKGVNLIAVRIVDKEKAWLKILVDSYRTTEAKDFVLTKVQGSRVAELVDG